MKNETYEQFVEKFKPKKRQMTATHRKKYMMQLCNS